MNSHPIFFLLLFIPTICLAWGENGHRIVGEIAERHLTPPARREIQNLMGTESLARSATWPDEVKSDPDHTHFDPLLVLHYMTIPTGKTAKEAESNEKGDILSGLKMMEAKLTNLKIPIKERQEALRYFVHFAGDIHQPLHVGRGNDRGGNDCQVFWFKEKTNLHVVWDTYLIDHVKLSYTEYVHFLDHVDSKLEKSWQNSSYEDWANESLQLREGVYPPETLEKKSKDEGENTPALNQHPSYCMAHSHSENSASETPRTVPEDAIPKLSWDYHYKNRPTVEKRLQQAGLRLAGRLNSIFSKK